VGMGCSTLYGIKGATSMTTVAEALNELGVENYKLEGHPTNETEFNNSFVKFTGKDADEVAIESTNPSDFGVTWSQVTAKIAELDAGRAIKELRVERKIKIAETDWWALSDLTMTAEQRTYRQALRDITNTYTSLDDVVWPEKP